MRMGLFRAFEFSWPHLAWLVAAVASVTVTGAAVRAGQQPSPRVIHITAERFSFTPSEIRIQAGEEVELRISSEDTAHGFHIDGTDITASVPKRGQGEVSVHVRLERAGRYEFACDRMCGAGHDFMRGVLTATDRSTGANR